ncbi:velvet factor-domain-containing protein [Podospora aff. communis PSN243]|uniref:Velvet factor-domain-containing protein n=1 Tax=Podospora aff. communis PSN243 TaxID=3040156 RepID=A0AAV9GMM1_9PEZI|nr:velvet factor-domain-containing protein [Podospora aff. communis PSN243]
MHQPSYPGYSQPYPPQLPSMPPPAAPAPHYPQDNLQMAAAQIAAPPQQSPLSETSQSQDRQALSADQQRQQKINLEPYSRDDENGWVYKLVVVQQPQRARMCGFGDKDRRPITPPPCVRLMVIDKKTGKEVNCNEIEHTMYVLNVDLWSEDALREVNLVRHTTATPSISSTTPASYASIEQTTPAFSNVLPSSRDTGYGPPMGYQSQGPSVNPYAMQQSYPGYPPQNGGGYGAPNQYYSHEFRPEMQAIPQLASQGPGYHPPRVFEGPFGMSQRLSISGSQPQGMFTRNLIGSLAASAFRLVDTEDKDGIWFVLQDLSVRTEGNFRLRFSFVNVGVPNMNSQPSVNQGRAPVLASVFSDVFQVYSAKKFPGVCDSTPLSKCFATQGIKIPIRKEGEKKAHDEDYDD